jgi:putative membrane protein
MQIIAIILTTIVAIEHLYILWMEMFAWETAGKKAFGRALPHDLFKPTKGLAANQGLYNGFLAAGLVWSFLIENRSGVSTYVYSFLDVLLLPESLEQ